MSNNGVVVASLCALALVGCVPPGDSGTRATSARQGRQIVDLPRQPAKGAVAAVASAEGVITVELALGKAQGVEAGTFFRVTADDDTGRLKGVLQVTEVLGDARCVARQIGLTDRSQPLAPGDTAFEITDLADLAGKAAAEVGRVTGQDQARDAEDERRFAGLRESYRKELARLRAEYDTAIAAANATGDRRVQAAESTGREAMERAVKEHQVAIAAIRTATEENLRANLAKYEAETAARRKALADENQRLSAQIERLLAEGQQGVKRLETAGKERAEADRLWQARIKAEVESRELLTGKLAELERRLTGAPAASTAALVNDAGRDEPVLDKLARLAGELAAAREKVQQATEATAAAKAETERANRILAENQQRAEELARRLGEIDGLKAQGQQLQAKLAVAATDVATAKESRAAAELARLEAERTLYDLAARVLRLANDRADTAALQERLKQLLAAKTPAPEAKP